MNLVNKYMYDELETIINKLLVFIVHNHDEQIEIDLITECTWALKELQDMIAVSNFIEVTQED